MNTHLKTRKTKKARFYHISAAIGLLAGLSVYFGLISFIERPAGDILFRTTDRKNDNIILITLDNRAFEAYGPYSEWTRQYAVDLINKIDSDEESRPAVLAFDVEFFGRRNPEIDTELADAAQKAGNVVVVCEPVYEEGLVLDRYERYVIDSKMLLEVQKPYPELNAAAATGIATPWNDSNYVRKSLAFADCNGERIYNFAIEICKKYYSHFGKTFEIPTLEDDNSFIISYSAKPKTSQRISLYTVLDDENFDVRNLRDKIVIVGAYENGMCDQFFVPVDKQHMMFGVEINANIVASLLAGTTSVEPERFVPALIVGILTMLFTLFAYKGKLLVSGIMLASTTAITLLMIPLRNSTHIQINLTALPFYCSIIYVAVVGLHYLRERKKRVSVLSAFKRYVAPEVVNELDYNMMNTTIGGIERDIAVLFVDIRGFTALSEKLPPETVVTILNHYLSQVTDCVFRHRGTLDKFIGDAAMAVYNSPTEDPDYIKNAADTALELIDRLPSLNAELLETTGTEISLGIGLHCGHAVVGNIGSEFRMDYTAIGDTVNTASRLESNAAPGTILISEAFMQALGPDYTTESIGEMTLKGKQLPIKVYHLLKGEK